MKKKDVNYSYTPTEWIRLIWLIVKYQLFTKGILALVVYPAYQFMVQFFIQGTGRSVFSSGDFLPFLLSFNGVGLVAVSLALMVLLIGVDINAFIMIGALVHEGKHHIKLYRVLLASLKSLTKLFSPLGLLIMVYISLIFPLLGLFITVSPMRRFQVPNFILSVIYNNPLYLTGYLALLLVLTYIALRYMFTFHYILLSHVSVATALRQSAQLMHKRIVRFIKQVVRCLLKRSAWLLVPFGLLFVSLLGIILVFSETQVTHFRFSLFFVLITFSEIMFFFIFILVPLLVISVTEVFYVFNEDTQQAVAFSSQMSELYVEDEQPMKGSGRKKVLIGLGIIGIGVVNLSLSAVLTFFFDELFLGSHHIALIAHRGGGDLGAENTIQGIEAATKRGVEWTEIDVQRTKDGFYIINHDSNFKRVADDNRASSDMTLEEIKALRVKNLFNTNEPSQPVATIDDVIQATKGKIGLFIELKGKTADTKMADDMVALIRKANLGQRAVLLSLDYTLITYIETHYPDIETGYLYYFAVGQIETLQGDYLIMEEREATDDKIEDLKNQGKKVVVWTVNTSESIEKFIQSNVDGIITDHIPAVQQAMTARDQRSDLEIIIDNILGNN